MNPDNIFVHVDSEEWEIKALFADMDGDFGDVIFHRIADETLADIVHGVLGKFKSRTEARKNGWSGEIPVGYREYKIGKHLKFWTFKPLELAK